MADAPLVKPFPLQAGHPANHGYVQCARCGTWVPGTKAFHSAEKSAAYLKWLESGDGDAPDLGPAHCVDVAWCSEQAKADESWCRAQSPETARPATIDIQGESGHG